MAAKATLFLFDVDGTLCESQTELTENMKRLLLQASETADIGIVSGSDEGKILREFGVSDRANLRGLGIRYLMCENGVISYDLNEAKKLHDGDILRFLGEERYQVLINHILGLLSQIRCPVKRDLMIETRRGNINVSPIGRRCSREERKAFYEWDKQSGCRLKLKEQLMHFLQDWDMVVTLGGEISVDICPRSWTKALVLSRELLGNKYARVVFFGDNCGENGNDRPLYLAADVGVSVRGPQHCYEQVLTHLRQLQT